MARESDENVPTRVSPSSIEPHRDALGIGRLGTYSMLGAVVAAVPLPVVPGSLAMRVRGALVHDVCARHGMSITPEARRVLARPGLAEGPEGVMGAALRFATVRIFARLGPLGFIPPLRSGVLTFAIGHLLSRYLSKREDRSVRLDVDEARRVRRAIENAITRVISTPAREPSGTLVAPEELRDQLTQATDGLVSAIASLPSYVVRRLEAAFDESMS